MKKRLSIVLCSIFTSCSVNAYEYTFDNKSDFDAEVQFKLAADIVANFPIQTVKVSKNSSAPYNITEWHRVGLCIDINSIRIKFLPDGEFKQPGFLPSKRGGIVNTNKEEGDFEYVVRTKNMPPEFQKYGIKSAKAKVGNPSFGGIECGNKTISFTHTADMYPLISYDY